uniref:AlNc14C11G1369 protein n=1 Tax=Albugo laibachii Nc14 TaxID=890382 RepID=F0W2Z0_9STRA|nr:AlNc14C11G1369 [Albugo laibachii Nc14]|eukprot:CCA15427.1 AlNc14C11G1369 [Albugo laibachii Nc14]
MRFAQAFHIRSLRDLFGGRTNWFDSSPEFVLCFSTHEFRNTENVRATTLLHRLANDQSSLRTSTQCCLNKGTCESDLAGFAMVVMDHVDVSSA